MIPSTDNVLDLTGTYLREAATCVWGKHSMPTTF
jgi:hypothetical protein